MRYCALLARTSKNQFPYRHIFGNINYNNTWLNDYCLLCADESESSDPFEYFKTIAWWCY